MCANVCVCVYAPTNRDSIRLSIVRCAPPKLALNTGYISFANQHAHIGSGSGIAWSIRQKFALEKLLPLPYKDPSAADNENKLKS